jgi:predicted membrane-bound spermidine synthase
MIEESLNGPTRLGASRRILPLLLVLFVGSGCAALIYEVVWLQLLQLVIGLTTASLGVLLGTFMGGMCLGSWLLARVVSARRHPLRVYAALELGIGVIGLLVPVLLPRLVASAEKAIRELGWKPKLPELEDIVANAWAWHRQHPNGYPD